jgi:hypothetical protein
MGVPGQVFDGDCWASERGLRVDDPVLGFQVFDEGVESLGHGEGKALAGEMELPPLIRGLQELKKPCAELGAQLVYVEEETIPDRSMPALPVEGEGALRHETVEMDMGLQPLGPRVKKSDDSEGAFQTLLSEPEKRLRSRLEEHGIEEGSVAADERVQLVRQGEDLVEIGNGEEFCHPGFHPRFLGEGPALGAVAVPAGVPGIAFMAATVAFLQTSAHHGSTALEDVGDNSIFER